jgi:hypothetical protein
MSTWGQCSFKDAENGEVIQGSDSAIFFEKRLLPEADFGLESGRIQLFLNVFFKDMYYLLIFFPAFSESHYYKWL